MFMDQETFDKDPTESKWLGRVECLGQAAAG